MIRFDPENDERGARLVTVMHFPWESLAHLGDGHCKPIDPEALVQELEDAQQLGRGNIRPHLFQTNLFVSPIDRVTHRVAHRPNEYCPYCDMQFRNPSALRLHVKEQHSADVTVLESIFVWGQGATK